LKYKPFYDIFNILKKEELILSKGKRYEEPKLNMKKVFAVIIAIIVFIMFIFIIKGILTRDKSEGKITSQDYFASYKDNKWGVINAKGENVIDPSYKEMIIIPNSKNDVFLCTYDVDYETGEYKTKALNSKNEEIFTQYSNVEAISNYDQNNNLWYEENVLKVEKDGKYGLINLAGKELASCEYEEIVAVEEIKGALKVKKDGKYGILDKDGKEIIKPQYADIKRLGKENKDGFIVKSEDGKYGVVDYSGNVIIESKYEDVKNIYGSDYYVVKNNGKDLLTKKDGTETNVDADEIKAILSNVENGIIVAKKGKYGVIKTTGESVIDANYDDLKEAKSGVLIAKQNNKYGIIDLEKNTKVEFKYANITYDEKANIYIAEDESYNNDIIDDNFEVRQSGILINIDDEKGYIELRQDEENKYYNFKFEERDVKDIFSSNTLYLSKKDGKYGFVDKDGNVVVDYIYDDATQQNSYGYAGIKKDGKWGSINEKGNIVQEPTYDLEDYLKVDFIGRWHLGKDLNMNYYNQL
jgi:hypothetical protein